MDLDARLTHLVLYARFLPSWDHIEPLRRYLEIYTKARPSFTSSEGACIVLQELLENAVKYGESSYSIELEICMALATGPLEIRVTNRANPARIANLARELRLTRTDSARDAFANALARLKTLPAGATMLGLARVAIAATLEAEVTNDRVVMHAIVT